MQLPNTKELVRLAKACRKAGITTFKGAGIEFTLSDSLPQPIPTKRAVQAAQDAPAPESDEPGYEQLLHWSITELPTEKENEQ